MRIAPQKGRTLDAEGATMRSFAYEVTGFTNIVLRRLIYGVRGEWTFTPDDSGAVIRWTYEFSRFAAAAGSFASYSLCGATRCRPVLKHPRMSPRGREP